MKHDICRRCVTTGLILLLSVFCVFPAIAAPSSANYDVYVYAADGQGLNLRAGPGTNYDKVLATPIPMYTRLHIDQTDVSDYGNLWGHTSYDGTSGWIYLLETTPYNASPTRYDAGYYVYVNAVDGLGLNMRSGPGTNYGKVLSSPIPMYTRLYIDQADVSAYGNPWGHTSYGGISGWVYLPDTTTYDPAPSTSRQDYFFDPSDGDFTDLYVFINDPDVNMRAGPGTNYGKVRKDPIPMYSRVHVVATAYSAYGNLWGYTSYSTGGKTDEGWIYLPDTTIYDPRPVDQNEVPVYHAAATEPENDAVVSSESTNETEADTFVITYLANGGSGAMPTDMAKQGEPFTLPVSAFIPPEGKQFQTWDIGGVACAPGTAYTFTSATNVTAIWEDQSAVDTSNAGNSSLLIPIAVGCVGVLVGIGVALLVRKRT